MVYVELAEAGDIHHGEERRQMSLRTASIARRQEDLSVEGIYGVYEEITSHHISCCFIAKSLSSAGREILGCHIIITIMLD